jgi:hypothetical protein
MEYSGSFDAVKTKFEPLYKKLYKTPSLCPGAIKPNVTKERFLPPLAVPFYFVAQPAGT